MTTPNDRNTNVQNETNTGNAHVRSDSKMLNTPNREPETVNVHECNEGSSRTSEPYKNGLFCTDDKGDENASANHGNLPSTIETSLEWYEKNGLSAIRLPAFGKDACWDLHVLDDEHGNPVYIDEPWSGDGVGLVTGSASHNMFDIVLHRPEAVVVADYFLPETPRIHSRKDSRKQHRWFYDSPIPPSRLFKDSNGNPLVEIRAEGCVTLAPCSVHPFGDRLEWHTEIPTRVVPCWESETFEEAVEILAACTELARNWPTTCFNVHCAAAVAHSLLRAGRSYDFTDYFITLAAITAGESLNTIWEIRRMVESVAEGLAQPSPRLAKLKLADCIGKRPAQRIAEWLHLNERKKP